jgi:hypothetical protein
MARFPEMFIGPVVQIKILIFDTKYIPQIYRAIILNDPHSLVTSHHITHHAHMPIHWHILLNGGLRSL